MTKRCEAVSPKGIQCKLEEGHYDHVIHMGEGPEMSVAWDDDAGKEAAADPRVVRLRELGDEAWERESKQLSTSYHDQATQLRGKIRQQILDRRARKEQGEKTMPSEIDFKPGIYKHYKGGHYAALMLVRHHETREPMVVYVSQEKGNVQVREWAQPEEPDRDRIAAIGAPDAWTDVVEWKVPMPDGSAATHGPRFIFQEPFK